METLLNIARAVRLWLYNLTSSHVFGVELDVLLHFGFGFLLFFLLQKYLGTRRAIQSLAVLILVKEVADIFLKSQLRYIHHPTPEMILDITVDVLTGVLGGLAAWLWCRHRAARAKTPLTSSS